MNSQFYNPPFDNFTYTNINTNKEEQNQNILVLNKNQNNTCTMVSDKYASSLDDNSVFSANDLKFQPSYDITEEFYKLHLLKLQNERNNFHNNYNIESHTNVYLRNNIEGKVNEREHYDIDTYEPPTYESWEEEEDLDMVIDLNRSTSISSGVFQFDDTNRDFQLNNQFQNFKL